MQVQSAAAVPEAVSPAATTEEAASCITTSSSPMDYCGSGLGFPDRLGSSEFCVDVEIVEKKSGRCCD
jgi:hypothetical protein